MQSRDSSVALGPAGGPSKLQGLVAIQHIFFPLRNTLIKRKNSPPGSFKFQI